MIAELITCDACLMILALINLWFFELAALLGTSEDFDGLVTMLEDYYI